MSSRTTFLHLSPQPIASSSRLPWAPIRRSFSYIHSSSPLPPLRLLRPPSSVTLLRERNVHSIRHASTVASTSTPPDIPPLPPRPKIQVTPPSLSAIKEEGYLDDDVVLIPEDQAALFITPEAIRQLVSITSREPPDSLAKGKLVLRCGVSSGGCHGYQYTLELTEERGVDDYVMQPEGVNCLPVVVDLVSLGLLKGATLHHATELIGSSFRIQDNPQAKEGGACGCGVSWEAKL